MNGSSTILARSLTNNVDRIFVPMLHRRVAIAMDVADERSQKYEACVLTYIIFRSNCKRGICKGESR